MRCALLVHKRVDNLLLQHDVFVLFDALALFLDGSNSLSEETVGGGEHVALVDDGDLGGALLMK